MKAHKRNTQKREDKMSRRGFISRSVSAVASFTIVPRHVLGGAGNIPPSEKLNIADIGVGGQGKWQL